MTIPRRLGKYEIRREIGRGAMGVVYEGFDASIGRAVAIKVLQPGQVDAALAEEIRLRFRREAQAAGQLSHPNIVAVHEYGEDAEVGAPFIAMEFVRGRDLKALFDANQRFTLPDIRRLMTELLGALKHAHDHGVVHRDIKPSNLIVCDDGRLKVADFGIARVDNSELTQTGSVLGTVSHMSPEQLMGMPVDRRTDIYSCGVILYELLTGEAPFIGSAANIIQKVLNHEPLPPSRLNPALPRGLDEVMRRVLSKNPATRYASADAFAQAMAAAMDGGDSEATVMRPAAAAGPAPARMAIGVGAGVAVGLAAVGAAWIAMSRSTVRDVGTPVVAVAPKASAAASMVAAASVPLVVALIDAPASGATQESPPRIAPASAPASAAARVVRTPSAAASVAPRSRPAPLPLPVDTGVAAVPRAAPLPAPKVEPVPAPAAAPTPAPTPTRSAAAAPAPAPARLASQAKPAASAGSAIPPAPDCDAKALASDRFCQTQLAFRNLNGRGMPRNEAEAAHWFRKAADLGHDVAQHQLGLMYLRGIGVGKDAVESVRWTRKAAEQGFAPAQVRLGLNYQLGDGLVMNQVSAADWYRKAADQGNAQGQTQLGRQYLNARGVFKDTERALALFRKAAEQGNADAAHSLGYMAEKGEGVPRSEVQAAAWYRTALARGLNVNERERQRLVAYVAAHEK